MDSWVTIEQVAETMKMSPRQVRRLCVSGELPGARKVQGVWEIPASADVRLARADLPDVRGEQVDLADVPRDKQDTALRKLGILRACEQRVAAHVRGGGRAADAIAVCVAEYGIDRATFFRWRGRYRGQGVMGLVDSRGGGKSLGEIISPEAFEHFKSLYLDPRAPSLKQSWRNLCFVNREQNKGWRIPSLSAMYNYVTEFIPMPVQVLHREGLAAYEAKCAPYIQSDPESCQPGEVWISDHAAFNC